MSRRRRRTLTPGPSPGNRASRASLACALDGERIKFSERAMQKLAEAMEFTENGYFIRVSGRSHRIHEAGGQGA